MLSESVAFSGPGPGRAAGSGSGYAARGAGGHASEQSNSACFPEKGAPPSDGHPEALRARVAPGSGKGRREQSERGEIRQRCFKGTNGGRRLSAPPLGAPQNPPRRRRPAPARVEGGGGEGRGAGGRGAPQRRRARGPRPPAFSSSLPPRRLPSLPIWSGDTLTSEPLGSSRSPAPRACPGP